MATNKVEFVISAKDEASQVIKNVDKNAQQMSWSVSKSFDSMVAPSAAFLWVLTAVSAWMVVLANNGLTAAADLETAEIGLTTLLKSADEAGKTVARIKEEAARTPFELVGLTQAVQLLSSVTKDGDKAIDIVLDVGEGLAAMGKWQPELDRIIVNLQQIASVGKASMLDIKQFAFAGIPIFEMLSEQTWLYGEELGDLITNGGVTFDLLTEMFDKANDEWWDFFNAYKNQAGSFNQALSNMKDSVTIFLAELVKQTWLFDAMKKWFILVTDSLPKLMTLMQDFAQTLRENPNLVLWIAAAITAMLVPALVAAASAALPFIIAGGQLILIAAAIGAAVYLLAEAWSSDFMWIKTATLIVWEYIKAAFNWIVTAWIYLYESFFVVRDKIVEVWSELKSWLSNTWDSIIWTISSAWSWLVWFFETIWNGIVELFKLYVALSVWIIIFAFNAMWIDIVWIFNTVKDYLTLFWEWLKLVFTVSLLLIKSVWESTWWAVKKFSSDVWDSISTKISSVWWSIKWFVSDGMTYISETFKTLSAPIKEAWSSLWEWLSSSVVAVWWTVKETIRSSMNWIIDKINAVIQMANQVAAMGASAIGINIVRIPELPRFAHGGLVGMSDGGVVSGAGWIDKVPALLSAGEIVLNAAQQQNVGRQIQGGWTTVIVEVKNNNFYWDDENFAQKIWKTIMEDFKLHTAFPSFSS